MTKITYYPISLIIGTMSFSLGGNVYNENKLHINTPIFPDKMKFFPFYYKYNQKSMSSKGLFILKILVRLTCVLTPQDSFSITPTGLRTLSGFTEYHFQDKKD